MPVQPRGVDRRGLFRSAQGSSSPLYSLLHRFLPSPNFWVLFWWRIFSSLGFPTGSNGAASPEARFEMCKLNGEGAEDQNDPRYLSNWF
ncbi:hypothetical protein U1Q18_019326 [Sarracenia purpurea var. burkii]